MGNFLSGASKPGGLSPPATLRKLFKQLADLIKEFSPLVVHSKFIFVPGPSDPGFSNILPK